MSDLFRVTTYEIRAGTFTGTTYDLQLNQDLAENYFVQLLGADAFDASGTSEQPDRGMVRVTQDPFGTGALSASSGSDVLRLERLAISSNRGWIGTVAVIECLDANSTNGFRLLDVVAPTHGTSSGVVNTTATCGTPWTTIGQVVPYGGIRGGGVNVDGTSGTDYVSGHGRFYPSSTDTINWERNSTGGGAVAATATVYVVEWGSNWTITRVSCSGSSGSTPPVSYDAFNIGHTVTRAQTWLWASGYTADGGIGDSFAGTIVALGNGSTRSATETQVAVGQFYADTRVVEVYVHEHEGLQTDWSFFDDFDAQTVDTTRPLSRMWGMQVPASAIEETFGGDETCSVIVCAGKNSNMANTLNLRTQSDLLDAYLTQDRNTSDGGRDPANEDGDYFRASAKTGEILDNGAGKVGEFGVADRVSVETWTDVTFASAFATAPVVVTTLVIPGGQEYPLLARIRNVSTTGFQVYLLSDPENGTYENALYASVNWIAVEEGSHTLPSGDALEAGSDTISGDLDYVAPSDLLLYTPSGSFTTQRVLHSIQTAAQIDWQQSYSFSGSGSASPPPSSGQIRFSRGGDDGASPVAASDETIGWIVAEDGSYANNGNTIGFFRQNAITDPERMTGTPGAGTTPRFTDDGIGGSAGGVLWSEGRLSIVWLCQPGTGNAFPRPYWGSRILPSSHISLMRAYHGLTFAGNGSAVEFRGIIDAADDQAGPFETKHFATAFDTSPWR